jgi:DNA helicase HerA-like ATPase
MGTLDQDGKILVGKSDKPECLTLAFGNRHGLITGATGTGKTVTLQVLAEGFSRAGVPVFAADIKGDLSGIAARGEAKPAFVERAKQMGYDYAPDQFPVVFWDLFGEQGHPIRATVHDLGPLLLARMLDLNDVQEGVVNIAFKVVDEADGTADGVASDLIDLANLRELLAFLGQNAKDIGNRYGNVAPATIGAVQRQLLVIENQGGEKFFGTPDLDLGDFMATDSQGRGRINILAADKLMQSPRLYATFLLWLIAELFERLPEVGDLDKPKLVFFFDEAHLLFNEAPKALLDRIEQVVRLIRSKGVGIYFVTQNPLDVPDTVLAQLGNRVQHALRAFTPRDQKAVRSAAETFRPNPKLDTAQVITELGKGEALVSFLEGNGTPSMVERALIRPPAARIGPLTVDERKALLAASPVKGRYEKAAPHRSLTDVLSKAAGEAGEGGAPRSGRGAPGEGGAPAEQPGIGSRILGGIGAILSNPVVRQFGRSVAAVVARTATQEAMKRIGMSPSSRRTSARSRRDGGFGLADIDRAADKLSSRPYGLVGDDGGDRGLFGTPQRPAGRR